MYSSEGLMLKLKLQHFGHLMRRPWWWERLKAGGESDDRGWDGWMASPTQWTWPWANTRRWWRTGKPSVLQSMGLQRVRHNWATEQQQLLCLWLPWWLSGKEPACWCRRWGFDPGLGRSRGEGNGNPLQYSCLGNPINKGAWQAIVHGVLCPQNCKIVEHNLVNKTITSMSQKYKDFWQWNGN